jgi:hypothetical protein
MFPTNLDQFSRLDIGEWINEDFRSEDFVRMNGSVVLQFSFLELDHVEDGGTHDLAEQSVLVVQLTSLAHCEEELEKEGIKIFVFSS